MSIAKRRGTLAPPITKPSTCARECVPPCQALATRQWVIPFAGSLSTSSISVCTASVSIPLTTLLGDDETVSAIMVVVDMSSSFHAMRMDGSGGSQHPHRGEAAQRVMNAFELGLGCQAGERAGEMWVLRARKDVLPAVGFEKGLLDHAGLEPV